jgi:SAM-dependent methyltransferase
MALRYFPRIFDPSDLPSAKKIILTDEGPGADTNTRWELETPYVLELIVAQLDLRDGMHLLDYGCGIGRLAKAILEKFACTVIGVDLSPQMRSLAAGYVNDERFLAVSPSQFDTLIGAGLRLDRAISVWVLQHCFAPADDIARMKHGLARGARGFVLNMNKRAVPAVREAVAQGKPRFHWVSDGFDVAGALRKAFHIDGEGVLGRSRVPNTADAGGTFWMSFTRE